MGNPFPCELFRNEGTGPQRISGDVRSLNPFVDLGLNVVWFNVAAAVIFLFHPKNKCPQPSVCTGVWRSVCQQRGKLGKNGVSSLSRAILGGAELLFLCP